jgi:uncharacterized membrane protein YhfC
MVLSYSILFMAISAFIGLFVPIIISIFLSKKYNTSLKAALVGAAIFSIFQLATRLPLLQYLQKTYWYSYNLVVNPWLIYILLGLSAGIFEEVGRFVGIKYFLSGKQQWKNGIAYGIGHGGIEAIIFCGVPLILTLINSLTTGIFPSAPSYMFLISGIERISAMIFHVGASLMVLYAVRERKYRYLLYAILAHGILDSAIGFINGIFFIELWAAAAAMITLSFIIIKIKNNSLEKILS